MVQFSWIEWSQSFLPTWIHFFYNQNHATIKCSSHSKTMMTIELPPKGGSLTVLMFTNNTQYHKVVLGGCFQTHHCGTRHERFWGMALCCAAANLAENFWWEVSSQSVLTQNVCHPTCWSAGWFQDTKVCPRIKLTKTAKTRTDATCSRFELIRS